MKLNVEDRELVIPGELLAEGMDCLPKSGTYREQDKIFSSILGMVDIGGRVIGVIPLKGRYMPKKWDIVIGKVEDVRPSGWVININAPYNSNLSLQEGVQGYVNRSEELSKFYTIGDYIIAKIIKVTPEKLIDLSMQSPGLRKILGGKILEINPQKVARVIGKEGSMIRLLKDKTGCFITVGQNGWIWIKGTPEGEVLVTRTIDMIEKNAHISGLTEKIEKFLEKEGKNIPKMENKENVEQ